MTNESEMAAPSADLTVEPIAPCAQCGDPATCLTWVCHFAKVEAAIAAEREACARIADEFHPWNDSLAHDGLRLLRREDSISRWRRGP